MKIYFLFLFLASSLFAQERLAIFTFKNQGVSPWDPDSIEKGIAGSEEAVIYLSQELAALGYKVVVLGNPPKDSPYKQEGTNPQYVDLDRDDGQFYDIAIAWRMPTAGRFLKTRAKRVYLWPHDTLPKPIVDSDIEAFDGVFWLSQWQRKQWSSVSPKWGKFQSIFGNGIVPGQFASIQERKNPYSCIYGSNYARGLEVLLEIWPTIKHLFPKAVLDIYYGWQHWGCLTPEQETKLRKRVSELSSLGVQDHGLVGHAELNEAYVKASFWTYPCIAPETFCITALRAQLSGAVPVVLLGSALNETVRYGYGCRERDQYLFTLIQAMQKAESITLIERKSFGEFVKREFTWAEIAKKWHQQFLIPGKGSVSESTQMGKLIYCIPINFFRF